MKRIWTLFIFSVVWVVKGYPGDGMWIPLLLDSLNYTDMQEKGLRLLPEQIYSSEQVSLKDAVVMFGNGCTGEVISPEGLLITNHHCGYSRIVSHSTVENDYLTNGFWAGSKSEELPNPGLSVTFLVRIENVTKKILAGISDSLPEDERIRRVAANSYFIREEAVANTHYQAEIKPFYFGKEYFLFVYEIFNDVRLVGAPPDRIGKFGGDTDNWVWPRHTGDFSLFRIYAGKDNQPAAYSPDNVPYKPKKYFSISMDGIKEGDFTMVLGYPARTDLYLTSDAIRLISGKSLPAKIGMRTLKLNAMSDIMKRGTDYKLRYASKYQNTSNAWKKWIGVTEGVQRASVIEYKKQLENVFDLWAKGLDDDTAGYSGLMTDFKRLYAQYEPLYLANDLAAEMLNSLELSTLVNKAQIRFFSMHDSSDRYKKNAFLDLKKIGSSFFKTNALEIDRKTMPEMLKIYANYVDAHLHPDFYKLINEKFSGDFDAYTSGLFEKSIFTDSVRYHKAVELSEKKLRKKIINDPLIEIYRDFSLMLLFGSPDVLDSLQTQLNRLYRKYITGMMQMNPNHVYFPDANFTMRLSYGKVEGYKPYDAIEYSYTSTLDGIIEKEDPDISDYKVPEMLKKIYVQKDYGPYSVNNKIPVCFTASNHTSGGNSGSPVLNADGNLIGINFDRNWQGTVSDFYYDPAVCRNISLDIRYVLFIIDKYADADWLLNELTLIKN
jgi:hypothetical protein